MTKLPDHICPHDNGKATWHEALLSAVLLMVPTLYVMRIINEKPEKKGRGG